MVSSRRAATGVTAAPVDEDPNRTTQRTLQTPRGEVRAWFQGGRCRRVRVPPGRMYGFAEAPDVWAALLDGSFRPDDFGKHYR